MFDSEFLTKLEHLSMVSRRTFQGWLLARRRRKRHDRGVEFADHREYVPGDDLRSLDWNIYARFGQLMVKRFTEEEDLPVHFFLDCSKSMKFGKPDKFDYAREITAALAYIVLADWGRVGVVAFADGILDIYPLTRGKQHIVGLMRFLERLDTTGTATNLAAVAREFSRGNFRTGPAVLVSDFFDPAGFQGGMDLLRFQRCEPFVIQVHDQSEAAPRLRGDFQLIDMETGGTSETTISDSMLRRYKEKFNAFLDSIKSYCLANDFGCTITQTRIPFDQLILRMMRIAEPY
ncbi:MAG: DUF58 domain-containing protein [Planctomycetaceae bacterium]|nr:DUF58 domain-containing protein [Planctomycetaceae bacterium]